MRLFQWGYMIIDNENEAENSKMSRSVTSEMHKKIEFSLSYRRVGI